MSALGANISTIPVLDVHSYNVMDVWPSLRIAINSSQFISIDLVSSLMMLVHSHIMCLLPLSKSKCSAKGTAGAHGRHPSRQAPTTPLKCTKGKYHGCTVTFSDVCHSVSHL